MSVNSKADGGPASRQGSSNRQQVVREDVRQQTHLQAAQLLARQPRVMASAVHPYGAHPYVVRPALPGGGIVYSSMLQPTSSNMGLSGMPYNPTFAYHLPPPALCDARSSLFQPIASSIPTARLIQTTSSAHQATIPHRLQPTIPMAEMTAHSVGAIAQPESAILEVMEAQRRKTFVYRDYAKEHESIKPLPYERSNQEQTFPVILYRILSNSECKDCISWLPHGRAFKIYKSQGVEEQVLPLYFRSAKMTSFMRQVNGWGFRRMPTGPDRNSYYHEMFLRGFPYLCTKMRRPTSKLKSSSDPKTHPDFYDAKTMVALPNEERGVTCESTSPTNTSSGSVCRDTSDSGSGSDQGVAPSAMFGGSSRDNQVRAALYPERERFSISNLCSSSEGSDQDPSRLGGKLYGSVVGSENGSNADTSGSSSEQGCGSDNGSSGDGECSSSHSPSIHTNGNSSDETGGGSFHQFAAYVSRTSRSSGSYSVEGGALTDSSSSARKSSELSQSNGKSDTPSSNGNSSDGSGSVSYLHLLTDTALRAAAPAFVMTEDSNSGDSARDNISSAGSDTGTEQVSDMSSSRWTSASDGSSRKRGYRHMTTDVRLEAARKSNINAQQGESSDGSSSDDRGRR